MINLEEMNKDLIEIFDEEYSKRYVITPQNTARKLAAKPRACTPALVRLAPIRWMN